MKKGSKWLIVGLLIMSLLATMVMGCGGEPKDSNSAAQPTLKVGTEPTFPPFEMSDKDGNIIGFDIDLIKAVGAAAGFQVEIQNLGFDALIPALQTGNIDIVASGMTIDAERLKVVDFSTPYFEAGLKVAVLKTNEEIKSVNDLQGKRVGAQIGTTGAKYANELKSKGLVKDVRIYDTVDVIFADLKNGNIDAVINDMQVTAEYIDKGHPEVVMVGEMLTGEQYGFAVKKGNQELLDKLNTGLQKVQESGKYQELYDKYLTKNEE